MNIQIVSLQIPKVYTHVSRTVQGNAVEIIDFSSFYFPSNIHALFRIASKGIFLSLVHLSNRRCNNGVLFFIQFDNMHNFLSFPLVNS